MAWRRTGNKPLPEPMLSQFTHACYMRHSGEMSWHWNGKVFILIKFSSLVPPEVAILTIYRAATYENFIKMKTSVSLIKAWTKCQPFWGHYFHVLLKRTVCIMIQMALRFVYGESRNNKFRLVLVMAWHRIWDKPLPEPLMTKVADAYLRWRIFASLPAWSMVMFPMRFLMPESATPVKGRHMTQ